MPTLLAGTTVSIAGQAAFISYVSPGQINAQVPATAPLGKQEITVSTAAGTSQSYSITIEATRVRFTPAVFSPGPVGLYQVNVVTLGGVTRKVKSSIFASGRAKYGIVDTAVQD
jgi:hypothetical protein